MDAALPVKPETRAEEKKKTLQYKSTLYIFELSFRYNFPVESAYVDVREQTVGIVLCHFCSECFARCSGNRAGAITVYCAGGTAICRAAGCACGGQRATVPADKRS